MPTTEFAEEVQQRTQILIGQTKKNNLKYKDYYDRKAKAAPLKEKKDYCFVLQPKADSQASKIPFREYRWIGPFVVQTVLSNDNYIVRRLNTNKTQILHRNRLKKFVPNAPLEDNYDGETLQPDNEIVVPQDDLGSTLSHGKWISNTNYLNREKMIGPTWPHADRPTLRTVVWKITSSRMNAAAQARLKTTANDLTRMTSTRIKHERNRVLAETCRHHWMK